MIEKMKKGILMAVGLASLTKKEAEKRAKMLVKEGFLTKTQAKEVLRKILQEAEKQKKKIEKAAEQEAKKYLKSVDERTKRDISRVIKKIHVLETKLKNSAITEARKAAREILKRTQPKKAKKKSPKKKKRKK